MSTYSLPELERMAALIKKIKELETQLEFLKTELKALEDKE